MAHIIGIRELAPVVFLALVLVACGSDGSATPPGGADAGDDCTGGSLCGQPAMCCAAGSECVEGACLATCDSNVRCGADLATCCATGDVCLADACATPGDPCGDSYDCPPGQFCEPTLDACLPQPENVDCQVIPQFDDIEVTVEWSYDDHDIISIPVVTDLDGDASPEVVVNLTLQDGGGYPDGRIAVLSGTTGAQVLAPIPHAPASGTYGSHGRSTIAAADVSGDGLPDIIYASRVDATFRSLVVAIDGEGNLLWTSHDEGGNDVRIMVENGGATVANFDADPEAEIVFGGVLIDHDGLVVWDATNDGLGSLLGSNQGSDANYKGGISAIADLDGDGRPEIVSGRDAWQVDWQPGPSVTVSQRWQHAGPDGYPAIADVDQDGVAEVVLVGSGTVRILDGITGELYAGAGATTAAATLPGAAALNRGGPPTIADFDDDGRPEIGVAGGHAYAVFDLNRPGEDVVVPPGAPAPGAGQLYVRWSRTTQDLSSNASGSSVFDFQGDGAAEVVYADECYMRVYDGSTGDVVLEIESTNATIHEYPLVVDLDADGNSEILIVANETDDCAGVTPRKGLFVYGDVNDEWVPTRRVWNQHAYHVTNVRADGTVPAVEDDNWLVPGLNNYRQNVQGEGIFYAPDLLVDLAVGIDDCDTDEVELRARVSNQGALGVPAGVEVRFYLGSDASGELLGTAATTVSLLPGQSANVSLVVPAPAGKVDYFAVVDGSSAGAGAECDAENNTDLTTEAGCAIIE